MLVIDRYEIGERQTSACAMPDALAAARWICRHRIARRSTSWSCTRRFTPSRWPLPWSFSTFDYRELCALLWQQADDGELEFETATVTGRDGTTVHTDRGDADARR